MNTVEFADKKHTTVVYPSAWHEHTPEQHKFIMQQLIELDNKKITIEQFRIIVLFNFLQIKHNIWAYAKEKHLSNRQLEKKYENIWRLTQTLDYLFKKEEEPETKQKKLVLNYDTIINFVPEFTHKKKLYIGPKNAFNDLIFQEFLDALNHFKTYIKTRDIKDLNRLVATFYRPEIDDYENRRKQNNFDGQRRIKYNRNIVDIRAEELADIPHWIKHSILLYFSSCYNFITSGTITVNDNQVDFSILFNSEEENNKKGLGMVGLLFKLAESGVFGPVETTAEQNIYDVLLHLYQQMIDYQNYKQKIKNKKNDIN